MKKRREPLPPFANEYLTEVPQAARVVARFHHWLRRTYRPVLQLESAEVEQFLANLAAKRPVTAEAARRNDRRRALRYLDWLRDHRLLGFDPRCLWPRSNVALPDLTNRFLKTLEPTHQMSTVRGYQTTLRQFHIWLTAHDIALSDLDRNHMCSWSQWLLDRKLHPSTRFHNLIQLRAYLRWLEEQNAPLRAPADDMIRSSDLPKLPQYLPRPVSPDTDEILQRRFRKSHSHFQLGLLLMRRTGLRIGELIQLTYDCVRVDAHGNKLLKVPLGKLKTERLVPLDDRTVKLIAKLRRNGPRRRELLLVTAEGQKVRYDLLNKALRHACRGLSFAEPMTTHRLRHTYATALIAGGMSLPAIMKLLGHRDYRMTLRYAAITDQTVSSEYADAMKRNEERYDTSASPPPRSADPSRLLSDLVRYLNTRAADDNLDKHRVGAVIKRAQRLNAAVRRLLRL